MSGSGSSARGGFDARPEAVAPTVEPVGLTVHGVPSPDAAAIEQRTRAGRLKMLLVLLVCASPVIASYFAYYVIRPDGRTNYAQLILPTRTMPTDLPLASVAGQPVAPAQLRRQWLLVVVGPGGCDAGCQQRLTLQRQLHQMLGRERARVDKVWLVTDGQAPDAALLGGLTSGADPAQVLRVPRERLAAWLAPAEGRALEDHLYVVDPMGEWMMRTPPDPEPQRLKRDLERLLRASSSWDTAGR
jgi:hypothetical protein